MLLFLFNCRDGFVEMLEICIVCLNYLLCMVVCFFCVRLCVYWVFVCDRFAIMDSISMCLALFHACVVLYV